MSRYISLLIVFALLVIGIFSYRITSNPLEEQSDDLFQSENSDDATSIKFRTITDGFNNVTDIASNPSDPTGLYIIEQSGQIWRYDLISEQREALLDVSETITSGGERGLLSLVFAADNRFYINYTVDRDGQLMSVIERRSTVSDSGEALLEIPQPYSNHNGGDLAFGLDGMLYIATGDGGSSGDPENYAQNLESYLGKILRINVSSPVGYEIPNENPFTGIGGLPEIWSFGFRNPWRFSFDRMTGDMWVADVGQSQFEEVNFEPADSPGGLNYGWRCFEGPSRFDSSQTCDTVDSVSPKITYQHEGEQCSGSVTGGFVYRGQDYPSIDGTYFYADFCKKRIYSYRGSDVQPQTVSEGQYQIATFGESASGELFFADRTTGQLYQIVTE
jgi:glucose/arabinose dehydrogenase